jgi:hypothetical protein
MHYVQGLPSDKRAAMRSTMMGDVAHQPWEATAGVAEAWGTADPQHLQRVRGSIAVSRHSMSDAPSPSASARPGKGGGGGGAAAGGLLWPAQAGQTVNSGPRGWSVPAAALAMAQASGSPVATSGTGQSTSAQRPPVYRAGDAAASVGRPARQAGGGGGAMNSNVSAKTGGRAAGWNAAVLQSPREAAAAPRLVRRQHPSRGGSRRSSSMARDSARAARARVAAHISGSIVTPTGRAAEPRKKEAPMRMRGRTGEGRRPGSAGRHLAPAQSAGPDGSMFLLASPKDMPLDLQSTTIVATQPATDAPQCPLHADCKLLPAHDGFCRLHGPREASPDAAPAPAAASAPAPAAAPDAGAEGSASTDAPPVAPPRPVLDEAAVEQARESWEQQMVAWSHAQLESAEQAVADRTAKPKRSTRRAAGTSRLTGASASNGRRQASTGGWTIKPGETVDTSISAKSAGSSRGWTAVTAARSKTSEVTALGSPKAAAVKKLARPASGRSWLAARRTAATNAGKAELGADSPPASPAKATTRRGPRAAVDHARATQASLARAAEASSPQPDARPARPSTAGLSSKKKPSLRTAAMAASLGSTSSSLPLEEQLRKRIEEKYRRDTPDIPTAVWLLRALQRTRAEACASNIIPARCLQDIPGVLHIPSGLMPELVQRFGPSTGTQPVAGADTSSAMVDYRKLVGALFPPLMGLRSPDEEVESTVKTDGGEVLAYLDYGAMRSRVRAELASNRSRLIDVFRVAMDSFGGRRLNIKVLQFAFAMLRIHITAAAIKHFFGSHISSGVVGGHAVASELMTTSKDKKRAGQKDKDEKNVSREATGGTISPAVSSPDGTPLAVEDAAARQVAAIVAAAREKSTKRSQVEGQAERARAIAVKEEQTIAKVAASEEVNSVLDKYLQLSSSNDLPSTKLASRIGESSISPDKELERAARSAREQQPVKAKTVDQSVHQGSAISATVGKTEISKTGLMPGHKAAARMAVGTSNLEQAWADQVSHRFGLAWALKHDHSVANPSMMEGVSDSSIQALWEYSSKARDRAHDAFTNDLLVRSDAASARGGGVLKTLEQQATKPPERIDGDSFMSLSEVTALMSKVSSRGRTWAKKHVISDRGETLNEPPDPEIPDFLKNDERSFTRLELSRRPHIPSVPQQQIESILARAKSTQAVARDAEVLKKVPAEKMGSSESDSSSEEEQLDDLVPTRGGSANSRASSASSTAESSPARSSLGNSDSPGGPDELDDIGLEDTAMVEWERHMTMQRREADGKSNLFGGYSSSDLSAEELDDENLHCVAPSPAVKASVGAAAAGEDETSDLMVRAQRSVEGLRKIEQLADEQKWPSSSVASMAVGELELGRGSATASQPGASDSEAPAALETTHADSASASDDEDMSEDVQKKFSMMRLSQHPAVMSPNTFQINGKIIEVPVESPSKNAEASAAATSDPSSARKRLVRPASAPMRTKRWIEKDITSRVDHLGDSSGNANDEEEQEQDDDDDEELLAEDVLLGSLWLTQGAEAMHTASAFGRQKTQQPQQQASKAAAIAQAGAAALVEQQQLWEELRRNAPAAEAAADGTVTADASAPSSSPATTNIVDDLQRSGKKSPSHEMPAVSWPKVKPGHRVQLLDLILFSDRIRAAILDALPWPTLRRCRQLCKRMALVCCEAAAQRPQIAVLGGNTGDTPTAKVTAFDLPTATWRRLPNMSAARSNAAVCTMMDGRLLVAGGFDADGVHESAEVFDPVAGRWEQLPPMSTARSGCRACPMLDSSNGAIVMGGYDAELVTVGTVECYDAHSKSWKSFPPLSGPRYDFSACVLPRTGHLPSQRERIVVAGGTADTSAWLKTAEVFDGNSWHVLPSMSMQRDRCSACVLPSGAVAVLGGSITRHDSTQVKVQNLQTCETYDFVREQWTEMPSMHAARCNFGAVAVPQLDGCVAVLGGEGGAGSRAGATAEVYHPRTKKWTMLTAMNEPRAGCGAAVLSVATWRSDIELELSESATIARIRTQVSRPQQLTESPVRFYKSEKEAQAALYGTVSMEMGACVAQDMLIGKRYFTGQRTGRLCEGPAVLVTATRMGGAQIMFGDGSSGIIGK